MRAANTGCSLFKEGSDDGKNGIWRSNQNETGQFRIIHPGSHRMQSLRATGGVQKDKKIRSNNISKKTAFSVYDLCLL